MRYPVETLDAYEDDGTMPANVATLAEAVVGHRIVAAEKQAEDEPGWPGPESDLVLTLDNGTRVELIGGSDCCAYTGVEGFFLAPESVDHIITGVGTTDGYTVWHIYADWGDILKLDVGWSCGNPFYYGYGFDIRVKEANADS